MAKWPLGLRKVGAGAAADDTKYDSVVPGPSFLRPTVNPFTPYSRDESVRSSHRGAVLCFASGCPTPQGNHTHAEFESYNLCCPHPCEQYSTA